MRRLKLGKQALWTSMIALLTLIALLAALVLFPAAAHGQTRKQLLVLNSYSPGYKWTDDILKGVAAAKREAGLNIGLQYEFMGTKRISDPEYLRLLFETFRYKYRSSRFDAIIASDNDAFLFLLKYRDLIFPGTPVVFCGVNDFQTSQLHGARLFTGVSETPDIEATLDLALKLHPKTRHLVIINDTTTTGRAVHNRLLELIPKYRQRVDFEFLENMGLPQIVSRVKSLGEGNLVLFTFFFKDNAGKVYDFDESISVIAKSCPVPIYGVWDFNLGYGILGGMLTSGYFQGKTAGAMAMRILKGEDVGKIPIVMKSSNRYMFDYRQLRRFHLSTSVLPRNSIVINRPIDIYQVHKAAIWGFAAAFLGLVFSVLLLLRNMSIKKEGERKLRQLAQQLEQRVQQRTHELEISQADLERQNIELQLTYQGLEAESADRIRVMEELRIKDQLFLQQSRMAAMGEMLGNIAHQWRQPLNLLGLKIQEIGLSYKLGAFSEELLNTNVSKAMEILTHLSKTIDDLRVLSTPDKKKTLFKVSEMIGKTISLIGENFKSHGITIEAVIDDEPEIDGYPNEYAQVLLNILMNSRDAFQERGIVEPRIILRAGVEKDRTEVVITDNAGGIADEIIGKIFDPYFTTKELGKGTGVGLFMSKTIIEKNMGGRLTARNTRDGVEFRISV